MRRTQIQLDEPTFERVRERAFRERISIAEVIRHILQTQTRQVPRRQAHAMPFSFIGSGRSKGRGSGTIASRHDMELADAFIS